MKPIKQKKTRKERRREIAEDDNLVVQGGIVFDWVEENWKTLLGIVAAALLLAGGGSAYRGQLKQKEDRAADALSRAEEDLPGGQFGLFSAPTKEEVDTGVALLDAVATEYEGRQAARIASLRAGVLLIETARYEEALERLDGVQEGSDLVALRARVAKAAALDGLERTEDAIKALEDAIEIGQGKEKEMAELTLGDLLDREDPARAVRVYSDFLSEHPDSDRADEVQKKLERAQARAGDASADGE